MASGSVSRFPEIRMRELRERVATLGCKLVGVRNTDDAILGEVVVVDPALGDLSMDVDEVDAWCVGREAASTTVPHDGAAWLAGADIAIDLLEEGASVRLDEMALQDNCRGGRPQANVFLNHLNRPRALNNTTSDAGFSAVMSEFVGLYADDLTMQALIDRSRRPIATIATGGSA